MRPAALLCLAFLLLLTAGCASNNKGKIEGTTWLWEDRGEGEDDKRIPKGPQKLEFQADKKFVYSLYRSGDKLGDEPKKKLTGKWSLNSGSYVTLSLDEPLGGRKQHVEKVVIDGEELTMTDSDGKAMTFTRVKPEQKSP